MSWTACRTQIVSIVEASTPTTKKSGTPGSFKHVTDADSDGMVPDSRSFWIEIESMKMKGHVATNLPRWFRYGINLVVAYRMNASPTLMFEIIAADHAVLASRLPDASLWGQPSSTIEGLFAGRDEVLDAEIEITDEGVALVTYPMTAEFRQT